MKPTSVTLDEAEATALRVVVIEWLSEEFTTPPYGEPFQRALKKLGIDPDG